VKNVQRAESDMPAVVSKQVIYIVPKSRRRIRANWGWVLGGRIGWLKVVAL